MSEAVAQILQQISNLSEADRAEVVRAVLDSLDSPPDAEFDAELNRRVDRIRAGQVVGIPAEEVFAELRRERQ